MFFRLFETGRFLTTIFNATNVAEKIETFNMSFVDDLSLKIVSCTCADVHTYMYNTQKADECHGNALRAHISNGEMRLTCHLLTIIKDYF